MTWLGGTQYIYISRLFCGGGLERLEADSANYYEAFSHGLICLSTDNVVPSKLYGSTTVVMAIYGLH